MKLAKDLWAKWRKRSANLSRWIIIPAVCYLELLFHFWVGGEFSPAMLMNLLGFGLCLGGLLNLAAAALPRRACKWFAGISIFLCTTVMMVELLVGDAYFSFLRPVTILSSAGGVLTDFSDVMFSMIISNLGRIFIALLPLWLLLLSGKPKDFQPRRCLALSLALALIGTGFGFAGLRVTADGLDNLLRDYDFNNSMRRHGITVSMYMELSGIANRSDELLSDFDFESVPETEPEAEPTQPETEPVAQVTAPSSEAPTSPATEAASLFPVATAAAPAAAPVLLTEAMTVPTTEATTAPTTEAATAPATEPTTFATTEATTTPATEAEAVSETEPTVEAEEKPSSTPIKFLFEIKTQTEPTDPEKSAAQSEETASESAEPRQYQPHVIDGLDFSALASSTKDPTLNKVFQYMASLTPTMENEYTGMFKGKNLILICAESFSHGVIDPELTPTLYRLSTQGIQFTNAYVPLWTGNTSGGELALFSGLAMNCEMNTYSGQKPFNTIGRLLMNEGYFSRAYHNNGAYFYDRYKTHANLGYEKFVAMGSGLEKGVTDVWPASDQEMLEFTLNEYIDQQPFSIYYMTVSAHCRYNFSGNAQSKKNQDLVKDLPYSSGIQAYLAANLELEKGLTTLVAKLEEAGIADDTVIVLTADHYPYGLGTAWGQSHNLIPELYGVSSYDDIERDRNALIIWSGCLEGKNMRIDAPVHTLDILPTLSNLFGLEYDSRMTVGRDVLSDEEAIVIWPNYSWVTELGKYDSSKKVFTPFVDESQIPEGYVERISAIVRNKVNFSRSVQNCKFYTAIQSALNQ